MQQHFSLSPDEDIIARTRWYIRFRWFYILALAVPTSLSLYLSGGWSGPFRFIVSAAGIAFITNGIFYAAARLFSKPLYFKALAASLLISDIFINNYLIYTRGGVESRSVMLYVIPIIMSAVIFQRKGIYVAAALSLLSFNTIIAADYLGIIETVGAKNPLKHTQLSEVAYTMVFYTTAMIAVAVATDFIVRLLREKERDALKTIEDLKRAQAVGQFGSWEWDLPSNRIVWSDEMFRMIGIQSEAGGMSFERYVSFVHPKDRKMLIGETTKAAKKIRRFGFDYRVLRPDGSLRYLRAEGESLPGKNGRPAIIVGTAHDITEERLLDASKNDFVSLASHQLRTPATVVKQYLHMLLDGYVGELTDKQRDFLKIASDTNDHQIAIVNNLLGVAQLESGKIRLTMTQVDLVALLNSLVEEYAPRARLKDQALSFSTRYKHLPCRADAHSLRTVLENILDNAFKYTLPGRAIKIRLTKELNTAVIAVIDQGVGISSENLPKLFKKFSRIEHPDTFHEEGAGLGLYWAEKVVSLHGGRMEVESEIGKGTTFKVILQLGRRSRQTASRAKRASANAS